MTTQELLSHAPDTLASRLNQALSSQHCTLEQWIAEQAVDRESLLRYLEDSGYHYIPHRNRIE